MTLSLQEMSDRFEIQDLLYHYADIIDQKKFDQLRDVFTEDAFIDYSVYGGAKGNREEIIAFLKEAMTIFPNTHHMNANVQITVDGDVGTGRVMCFNPQEMNLGETTETFMLGLWYVDKYQRTEAGWRMSERVEEKCWKFNVPDFMNI
ncbi:nuclear transport factor 2 family protein [Oceanicoccus sp. KOV_DT_Chl]|uniref:nuclear transport factor 2 family protein n=1 Tax=Oceanicoccus sp. KOV_DT_Chl TaxID=1904639 RepID=UPI000C7E59FD|nr:nuclear transport factor 2 family protein [Oceanicoccus sp. KOV_DT_Chl]